MHNTEAGGRFWLTLGLYESWNGATFWPAPTDAGQMVGYVTAKRSDGARFWMSLRLTPDQAANAEEVARREDEAKRLLAPLLNCACVVNAPCPEHAQLFAPAE